MKKIPKLISLLVAVLALTGSSIGVVFAETTSPSVQNSDTSVSSQQGGDEGEDDSTPETRAKRITEYKELYPVQLTAAAQQLLRTNCTAAQAIGKAFLAKVIDNDVKRLAAYNDIVDAHSSISERIKDANVDVSIFSEDREKLKELIASYEKNMKSYKLSFSDLNTMDCVGDLQGFRSALDAVRANQKLAGADVAAVKEQVQGVIVPGLEKAKGLLVSDDDSASVDSSADGQSEPSDSDSGQTQVQAQTQGGQQ